MGGHLDVHPSSVSLVVGWHLGCWVGVLDMADFGLPGVYCSLEVVDAASGFGKTLVGNSAASPDCQDEAVCDGSRGVGEVIVLHVEEGLS